MTEREPLTRLIVFSDDWGRHPSSCQHLVRRLLPRYPVLWVNTVGTRRPGLSWDDAKKAVKKLKQWSSPPEAAHDNLTVVTPKMWPGFRTPWQRRLNARLIARTVNRALGPRREGERRIVITTLPLTADLIPANPDERGRPGKLDADRWVYYCVDDLTVWPGTDGAVMQAMDELQVRRVDRAVTVSQTLRDRIAGLGRQADLLTHGTDLEHWRDHRPPDQEIPKGPNFTLALYMPRLTRPVFLFWGLIDQRLDTNFCLALLGNENPAAEGTLVLVGPEQSADPTLRSHRGIWRTGPKSYNDLPAIAAAADVLVMPYRDMDVTRAMQPLKLKEYLATGKPVVVRDLPANREWADACDLAADAETFARLAHERAASGLATEQAEARKRLRDESWERKAGQFEKIITDD
jgi:glycosyltransferase involved in cell wall biosynthesis